MNSHSWAMASTPAKRAGPIERAGFTEVPVSGIVAKWIIASDRPMAKRSQGRVLVALVGDGEDRHQEHQGGHGLDEEGRPPGQPVGRQVAEGVLAEACPRS